MQATELVLHGQTISFRTAGKGPALFLLHGIAGTSATWDDVIPILAEHFTIVAPDLLGHGNSAKTPAEYSMGSYASSVRDLMMVLGYTRATILGHSLGGGVAMQFVYQFPEMCERLVLVSSGGLGKELHPILRLASVPGSELLLPVLCTPGLRQAIDGAARVIGRTGLRTGTDLREVWRNFSTLSDGDARAAFIHTVRSVIDLKGQRASAVDRLYLASALPTLIIWGAKDPMIPVEHADTAHRAIHGSKLAIFPEAGHFPYLDAPLAFVKTLTDFMRTTKGAKLDQSKLAEVVRRYNERAPIHPVGRVA